ncbi:MAG: hypothetical protein IJX99_06765 [Clostridia bacterium]|nr:hypothetical protein [Clostridia bacterium]
MKYISLEGVKPLEVRKISKSPSGKNFIFECDGITYDFLESGDSHFRVKTWVDGEITPHVLVFTLLSNTF